jgi:hypothetical protein
MRMCRRWPEASPAPYAAPPAGSLPDVPVLMLSGEVDLRTPNETARSAAADWPRAQVVVVPNTGHSTLSTDLSNCTSRAVRNFFRGTPVAATCRRGTSLLPALPPAPLSLRELRAIPGVPGVRGAAVNAAELTLFDVTVEFLSTLIAADQDTVRGGGLRGGRWKLELNRQDGRLTLDDVQYMPGILVSGEITALGTRKERAVLHLTGPNTPDGELRFGRKLIAGRLDGRKVHARFPGSAVASAARYAPVADRGKLVRTVLDRLAQLRRPLG